jgi:hypothetical protein
MRTIEKTSSEVFLFWYTSIMPSLRIQAKTSVTPEQFLVALTDFGPERGAIWGNSQSTHLTIHAQDSDSAEVTEGSNIFGGVWERLSYDWSNPNIIMLHTLDSNIWAKGSGWRYELDQADDGSGTVITATVTRYPVSKKGYLVLIFVGSIGKPLIKKSFHSSLRAIEKNLTN